MASDGVGHGSGVEDEVEGAGINLEEGVTEGLQIAKNFNYIWYVYDKDGVTSFQRPSLMLGIKLRGTKYSVEDFAIQRTWQTCSEEHHRQEADSATLNSDSVKADIALLENLEL